MASIRSRTFASLLCVLSLAPWAGFADEPPAASAAQPATSRKIYGPKGKADTPPQPKSVSRRDIDTSGAAASAVKPKKKVLHKSAAPATPPPP
jgi:hypothetical protein